MLDFYGSSIYCACTWTLVHNIIHRPERKSLFNWLELMAIRSLNPVDEVNYLTKKKKREKEDKEKSDHTL